MLTDTGDNWIFNDDWTDTSGSWGTPESYLNALITSLIICNFFLLHKSHGENKLVSWAFK